MLPVPAGFQERPAPAPGPASAGRPTAPGGALAESIALDAGPRAQMRSRLRCRPSPPAPRRWMSGSRELPARVANAILRGKGCKAKPLHDWTDDRGIDSVRPIWMTYLVEWVRPRLPEGYRAFLGGIPALTVASAGGRPDVGRAAVGAGPRRRAR